MNEPPFDPADEALIEQAVRGMRDELPDDTRMQRLEERLAPVLVPEARVERSWHTRQLPFIAGAALVIVGVVASTQHRIGLAPSSSAGAAIEAPASPPQELPTTPERDEGPAAAMPVLTVDALPSVTPAAAPRRPSASEGSSKRPIDAPPQMAPEPATSPADPGDELAVLEEARAALATDPARALALADEHAKRFQHPAFAQERERLAIDALVRSGRRTDAMERATRFESTYPRSPHLARVRALVAPFEKVP